jgi:uncharacterized protein YgbK (DUF1537 family)
MLLGAIADDLTGATDLSLMLARNGMRTVQYIGVPPAGADFGDAEAVVVALKSRTIAVAQAVDLSLGAAKALLLAGAEQLIFKYCSTFDSTDEGNIGPVAEALLDLLGEQNAVACPAFPAAGRSIYQGHLFVGQALLSDSPMKDHPLTPMRDANLVRVLQKQARAPVGLIPFSVVSQGPLAVRANLLQAAAAGYRLMIADAVTDDNLKVLGTGLADAKLITGGSGIAMGLPENFRRKGRIGTTILPDRMAAPIGRSVILAGSCSQATLGQVAHAITIGLPALRILPLDVANGAQSARGLADWVLNQHAERPALVYSSAAPAEIAEVQGLLGVKEAGHIVESLLAEVSAILRDSGFTRFLVAGGETSGAVVAALGAQALRIGPEIAPGVPWTRSIGSPDLALVLKSGNFGAADFFLTAWDKLDD